MRRPAALVPLLLSAFVFAAVAAPAHAVAPLTLGFFDPTASARPDGGAPWLAKASAVGARIVRVQVQWSVIEATQPTHPTDPADPAYRWAAIDTAIHVARAQGMRVVASILGAPSWAEGSGRPASAPPGSWRPNAAALGAFATAAARRYGSSVYAWQVWNEPNLPDYLNPQWVRSGAGYVPASPGIYRAMLNAVYRGVKSVNPSALVATSGTAPYGDPVPGTGRIQPVAWWRSMLCVSKRLTPVSCPDPARFDLYAHHPYAIAGPRAHAAYPDDAAIPDVNRITRVVQAAVAHGRALPKRHKRAWVTEISWDSSPPDPDGVPAARQARWLEGAFYQLWRQHVDTVLWFLIVDAPPVPSYAASIQSGIYLLDGTPKPAARAYAFPFVAATPGRRGVTVWGEAPGSGRVAVQRRTGGGWRTIARLHAGSNRVFTGRVHATRRNVLRAVAGGRTSLSWRVGLDG